MLYGYRFFSLTGFLLIAVAYGLARFSWGLMLPDIMHDMRLSLSLAGTLSAASFAAYSVAILFSPACTALTGPRASALLAGLFAIAGMVTIAMANGTLWLMIGVICAGISTGLVSPPLAEAVSRQVAENQRPVVNTVINAGTGGGIILSALAVLMLTGSWRITYLSFALFALIPVLMVLKTIPATTPDKRALPTQSFSAFLTPALRPPLVVAFLSGIASAAYWTFGPVMFHALADMSDKEITLAWLVTGVTGCAGLFTGHLINRFGVNLVHRMMQVLTMATFILLSFASYSPLLGYLVAGLYGFAYITLSGVLLVSGIAATDSSPATGLSAVFLLLAMGQVAGAAVFGILLDHMDVPVALMTFSGVALMAMRLPCTKAQPG